MKKALLLLASAALLIVGCNKEQVAENVAGEGLQTVSFAVGVESIATRAVDDNDGKAANINHWIMQVFDSDGEVYNYQEESGETGVKTHTFNVPLIKGQTYNVLFWADTKDSYVVTDLRKVRRSEKTNLKANADSLDAFSAVVKDFTTTVATQKTITLKRPFAQLNVVFTDLKKLYETMNNADEYAKFITTNFVAKAKVPTTFNVLTQEAGAPAAGALEMKATECYNPSGEENQDNYTQHEAKATLYMDYIFASTTKDIVDIDFSFVSKGVAIAHNFAAVPFQRNYRTNILGDLMSANAKWVVTVDPNWDSLEDGSKDYNVNYYEPSSITDAQNYIANNDDQKAKTVDLSKTTITSDDIDEADGTIKFELTPTSPVDMVNFTLPEIPQEVIEEGCTGWKITYTDISYPTQNVNVTAPEGTSVTIEAPRSHVTLNGELYEQVTATTSQSTLVVPAGVTVKDLIVKEGAVEIHGTVNHLTVTPAQGKTVVFKDCENLNDEVYAIAKQNIAEGYVADDATNSIVKKDFVQDENGVWHVMNAKAYNEFAAAVNGGTAFEGQTVVLDADIDFQNDTVAPIGNHSDNKPFKGTFNGNNKKLSNVTVQNIVGKQGVGIFGKVYDPCVIKDLTVENATVIGDKTTAGDKAIAYVGGIAGHGYATIQNCTFKGDIYAGHQMGGIAGSGGFTITGCTFEGNIISERDWGLGGIIGNCQDGGAISGNTAKGTISGKNANYCGFIAGGIIGCAIYTTYDVKDNYAAMSMSYDGVAFKNVYPIVGVYNIDGSEEDKSITDFAKLLDHLANNTWDKSISPKDSYSILYNNENPTSTGYDINYGAATTKAPAAMIGDTGYETLQAAFDAVPDGIETTITLNSDATYATLGNKNNIGAKTVILNLNGHSITGHMRGVSALTNYNSLDGATLVNYANLTINGEGTIGDLEGDYHHNALVNMSDGTNLTINGGTFVAKSCCVYHYSAGSQANTASININGGNFKAYENAATNKYVFGIGGKSGQTLTFDYKNASAEGAKGIYCSLAGTTINVHSGSITADINAINLSMGKNVTINIDGGKLETLDSESHANNYMSTGSYTGSSLPIYASAFGSENVVCNISGGEFIYPYYSWQSSGTKPATWERVINAGVGITSNVANANITASLTGGTYSTNQMLSDITNDQSAASGIVANGYTCKKNDDGTWTVVAAN